MKQCPLMGLPMAEDTNIAITVYLSPAMKKKLDRACKSHGYSVTGFARVAIQERLTRLDEPFDAEHAVAAQ